MKHLASDHAHIAVTMSTGTVTILTFMTRGMSPTLPSGAVWSDTQSGVWIRPATDANIMAELTKAFPAVDQLGIPKPQPVSYTRIAQADIPKDRTYRNAWRHDGKSFSHDLDHAKRLHLDRVKQARLERLGELDRDWMKLTGQGKVDEAQAIEAERQALRDVPQTMNLEQVQSIDELKAVWPANLPRRP